MDLALRWSDSNLAADLAVVANDLARDDGLETAVLLSLLLDRQAEVGDVLPSGESDRRGSWLDAFPTVEGDKIGSRLWLLAREKATSTFLARAEEYTREALAWLTEDRVAARVDVAVSFPEPGWYLLEVVIHRPMIDSVTYRYTRTWAAQGV